MSSIRVYPHRFMDQEPSPSVPLAREISSPDACVAPLLNLSFAKRLVLPCSVRTSIISQAIPLRVVDSKSGGKVASGLSGADRNDRLRFPPPPAGEKDCTFVINGSRSNKRSNSDTALVLAPVLVASRGKYLPAVFDLTYPKIEEEYIYSLEWSPLPQMQSFRSPFKTDPLHLASASFEEQLGTRPSFSELARKALHNLQTNTTGEPSGQGTPPLLSQPSMSLMVSATQSLLTSTLRTPSLTSTPLSSTKSSSTCLYTQRSATPPHQLATANSPPRREKVVIDSPFLNQVYEMKTPNYLPAVLRPPSVSPSEETEVEGGTPTPLATTPHNERRMLNNVSTVQPSRAHWLPNSLRDACKACHGKLSSGLFKAWVGDKGVSGKHHCRRCGDIFCLACVSFQAMLDKGCSWVAPIYSGAVVTKGRLVERVCLACHHDWLRFITGGSEGPLAKAGEEVQGSERVRKGSIVPTDWAWSSF